MAHAAAASIFWHVPGWAHGSSVLDVTDFLGVCSVLAVMQALMCCFLPAARKSMSVMSSLYQQCAFDEPSTCRRRVLLLGLDNSGKTALGQVFSSRKGFPSGQPRPEHHVLHHELRLGDCTLDFVDPCHPTGTSHQCAQGRCRALWENLLRSGPDAIVFVVDAADVERLPEAHEALHWVLKHPAVRGLPVLVLGNKVDLRGALDTDQLRISLGLAGLTNEQRLAFLGHSHTRVLPITLRRRIASFHPHQAGSEPHGGELAVTMCSIRRGWSADTGLKWLAKHIGALGRDINGGGHGWLSPQSCAGACLTIFFRGIRSSTLLSREAAILPLYDA